MYLVFLALIALNVDVSVLNSIVLVDDGLAETNVNFASKVDMVYRDFDQQRAISEKLVYPYYDRAYYVKELSDRLVDSIISLRTQMIMRADGISYEEADTLNLIRLRNKDNYSRTTRFWMTEGITNPAAGPGTQGSRAYMLRNMIEEYKEEIINQLDTGHVQYLKLGLDTEGPFYSKGGDVINWQRAMFDRIVPVAAATNLSRLVTDVRNAEFDVISILYAAITEDDFTFDQIEARVVPQSQVVMVGDHYEAEVFVAAYDTRQQPTVVVDGRGEIPTEDGVGRLRIPATREGAARYSGVIKVTSPAGIVQEYPFEGEYFVQRPSVTVSAEAMNVFYAGVDNPVSVSAPGIPLDNIRVSISPRGTITPRGGGNFTVRVPGDISEVNINVSATIAGTTRSMGAPTFRVRRIPNPIPTLAGVSEGNIDRQRIEVSPVIRASTPDDFLFDMDFEVASFTMITTRQNLTWERSTSGNRLTPEMMDVVRGLSRGARITITDIRTTEAADGVARSLPPVSVRLN